MTWIEEKINGVSKEAHEMMCRKVFGIEPNLKTEQNSTQQEKTSQESQNNQNQ